MPTKRTKIGRPRHTNITPEMIELYKRARALYPQRDIWEEDGGARRTFLNTSGELHALLGRYPHQENITDIPGEDEPPEWMRNDARRCEDFMQAVALRKELEELAT
jgi:hypothetical protein